MPGEHDVLGTVYMKEEIPPGVITVLSPLVPVSVWSTNSTLSTTSVTRPLTSVDGASLIQHHTSTSNHQSDTAGSSGNYLFYVSFVALSGFRSLNNLNY